VMSQLNQKAGLVFSSRKFKVNAADGRDAVRTARASARDDERLKTRAEIISGQVPVLDGIRELAEQEVIPGGVEGKPRLRAGARS